MHSTNALAYYPDGSETLLISHHYGHERMQNGLAWM